MQRSPLHDVCSAILPVTSLDALADLRCSPGITVIVGADRAWLRWSAGQDHILERVLAVAGVEMFVRHDGGWARFGSLLPAGPVRLDSPAQPLAHALTPAPVQPVLAQEKATVPVRLRLVRSDEIRVTSALRCRVDGLLAWADKAPTS